MRHMSNAGVIIQLDELSLGIDLFTEHTIPPYQPMPEELRDSLMQSEKSLTLLTGTHCHGDHYQSGRTGAYLSAHSLCSFFMPALEGRPSEVFHWEKGSLRLIFLPTVHMGQFLDIPHYSILILWENHSIFISGDARPSAALYQTLSSYIRNLDVLICPFPCLSLKSARKNLSSFFVPRQIFLVHLPDPLLDEAQWTAAAKKICATASDALPTPVFCENLGACYPLNF